MELKFDRKQSAVFRRKYIKIKIKFKKPYLLCVCCVFVAFPSFRRPFWAIFCLTVDATACHVLRDCSLFMAKGGSVIFNQFRHMKNLPLPGSGYFKKLPPVYMTGSKFYPPPLRYSQDATCLRLRSCVQHVFWPCADKPKSSARSFVIVQYESTQQGK